MEPLSTAAIIGLVLQYGLKYGPEVMILVRKILASKDFPTEAQWKELDDILLKTGESYFTKVVL